MSMPTKSSVTATHWRFRLYIAGDSPNSSRALDNLRLLIQNSALDDTAVEIVDVLANPARCQSDGVLVTPTLIRVSPEPLVQVIGDLALTDHVRVSLGLAKVAPCSNPSV